MDAASSAHLRSPVSAQGGVGAGGPDPYRPLFELAGVGLAQIDPVSFRFTRVNRKLCQITGYSEQELLRVTPIDITLPEDWQADRGAFESLLAGNFSEHVVEKRYVRKDGSPAWVMVTLNAIRDPGGKLAQLVSVVRDIDKRKRAEADLQKRNRALTFVSDAATQLLAADWPEELIPLLVADLAAHVDLEIYSMHTYGADGKLRLLACSESSEEVLRRIETMELGQDTNGAVALRREPIVLEHAQESTVESAAFIRSLGVTAWACYPLLASGRLAGTLALGTRRRATFAPVDLELIRTTCDQIAMALERRRLTLELEQRARDLAQANRAKDHFLAVLSHELRTPLTPVLLSASAMESDPTLPMPARDEMAAIRQNVELEARLIDDLLDLTRIARGKLQLDLRPVAAHDQLHQAIRTVAGDARDKGLAIVADLRASRHHVDADPARLQQILWNLLKNAIKFTPAGGMITIRTANHPTAAAAAADASHLVIEVADTGIGIPPDLLPKIFDAFEQGTPSITRRFGGLGLGLAISRALAMAHGGSLGASSAGKNQGATFRLTLPVGVAAPDATVRPAPTNGAVAAHSTAPLRILLVEDHASTASTLARLLRKVGHQVEVADGVRRALDLASEAAFDLLISDIGLPDGSGLDLMRQLRETRPIPGIALSGYGTDADVQRSLEAGFAQHLTKPINIEQLKALTRVQV